MERHEEPLEDTLRRVLREVLPGPGTKARRAKASEKVRKNTSGR
jgi:hypothetical protein